MGDAAGEHEVGVPGRAAAHRGRSVRMMLLLVVLLPIIGMTAVSLASARRLESERRAANALERDTHRLVELIEARRRISDEEVSSAVLVIGADLGVDADELREMYGQDFRAEVVAARAGVDGDPTLQALFEEHDGLAQLRALRPRIDAGTLTFPELVAMTTALTAEIDQAWDARIRAQTRDAVTSDLPASVQVRFQALTAAYIALSAAADRALLTEIVLTDTPTDEQLMTLVDATGAYRGAVQVFPSRLGPLGRAAWQEHLDLPAAHRFERVLDDTILAITTGRQPALVGDPVAFGKAYIDGPAWANGISETIKATALDLQALTTNHASEATKAVVVQASIVLVLALASLAIALWAARTVAQPISRLETAAHQVHDGHFDLAHFPRAAPANWRTWPEPSTRCPPPLPPWNATPSLWRTTPAQRCWARRCPAAPAGPCRSRSTG